ncbi:MAG: ATP-binding protein [Patescibacteria group bacterium]|nr:ATP-binding protein [Patescibacteria group bacterium]
MIHSFTCKNFYSFPKKTTISFVVNENAPDNNGYLKTPSGVRLSKAEIVIGSNASGKTNLLKIVPFLKWIILDSFNINPSAPIPVQPFMFSDLKNKPTELSVEFEIDGNIYLYEFVLNSKRIISENLKVKNKTKKRVTYKMLFSRNWDEESEKYNFEGKNFDLPKGFENLLRSNASVIGSASRLNHKESQEIAKYWQQVETNVIEAGWIGDHLLLNATQQLPEVFNFYSENESLKKEAEKLLSRFDLGLAGFEIEKQKQENGFLLNIKATHLLNGQKHYLPVQYESSGTKQLFVLLKTILQVLTKGGVAILDEFDVNLHPEMVLSLFELFIQPETNPKNAQILFSTHSHLVLSKLDKYQIILTEKNDDGASESWRLDEMSGVRADDNYYSKYIAGAYGAIPKIN